MINWTKGARLAVAVLALAAADATAQVRVDPLPAAPARAAALPLRVGGRAARTGGDYLRQWPGTYFETGFRGTGALFRIGPGEVMLHILIDGRTVQTLVKPAPGTYRVAGLLSGRHVLRVEVGSESQAAPTGFGGFFAGTGTRPAPIAPRRRQIEFIGDSHTVGYGVLSARTECTQDEVWATTDTSRGFGVALAKRYDADYEVNAISGRGVVRNYNGFAADTMPQAYPFVLFDKRARANEPDWHPQVIVIALGTNDFTTPLHAGEKWSDRNALHADYEATYLRLLHDLRARHPQASFVLWATDMASGEIESEAGKVAARLRAAGDRRVTFVPVDGLGFTGCHSHPSLADQQVIAGKLAPAIAAAVGWH